MLELIPGQHLGQPLRILCLGAHSDDIEIGCGATLSQLIASGRPLDIRWVVFSGNCSRAEEARGSADQWLAPVESKQVDLYAFRDGFFPSQWSEIKDVFEGIKSSFDPDIVFTHFHEDLHQDHRMVSELTWNTFRNHCIFEYEIPKYDGDMRSPNLYVPLSKEAADAKVGALMKYFGSQANKHWFCEELFFGLMRIRGMESCSPSGYAEGFHVRKVCLGL
ncbi:MAG: PIG-L deacetylase family protein [Verrucomicrobiota bacterium]